MLFSLNHFVSIFAAYEVLADEDKRKQYDLYGEAAFQPGGGGGGGAQDFHFNYNDFFKGFDDAFKGFKHGKKRTQDNTFGGFHFSFDDFFNDDDEDMFGGFGGFGDLFNDQDHDVKKYQKNQNGAQFMKTSHSSQRNGKVQSA